MQTDTLINGRASDCLDVRDRGFHYGDGLFETIGVESSTPIFLHEHLNRLQWGFDVLGFPPLDRSLIQAEAQQLIGDRDHGVLKLILSRGVADRGLLPPEDPKITRMISFNSTSQPLEHRLLSLDLVTCETRLSHQPVLAGIKHLNQLERILARREFAELSKTEGLMFDLDDIAIEGTMSNLFIVKNGTLKTPKLQHCGVKGIIRDFLIKSAQLDGVNCLQTKLNIDDLKSADEIFMTNSLMPIRQVKHLHLGGESFLINKNDYANWALNKVLDETARQISITKAI
ncbi:MAG: aminodeoxychorismate lyase [Cycloclasticus sp.]|nr:aminodeoxychorismate lyase [Cycloclasticus sp.]MBQ0790263.1 aminodeoxychorismate lyase [Cycloclasticus sp.]